MNVNYLVTLGKKMPGKRKYLKTKKNIRLARNLGYLYLYN